MRLEAKSTPRALMVKSAPHSPQLSRVLHLPRQLESHRRVQSQVDALALFQQSLKVTDPKAFGSSAEEVKARKEHFLDSFRFLNPSLEKNFSRLNVMKTTSQRSSPEPSRKPSVSTTCFAPRKTLADHMYINKHYQHPADSHATNRLPLPGTDNFDLKKITQRRVDSVQYKRNAIEFERNVSLADRKEMVLSLLPSEEASEHFSPRVEQAILSSRLPKYYWSVKSVTGNKPEGREGASLTLLSRKFYLFGGQSMTRKNDIRMLNADTWTWSLVPAESPPKGRMGHSLCPYKTQLILFGGWSRYSTRSMMRRCYSKLYVVSLEGESKWQRFTGGGDIPKARRDHAMASLGSSMLVFGGMDSRSQVLKSFRILDLEEYRWKKPKLITDLKPGRRYMATLTAAFHPALFGRFDFSIFALPPAKIDQVMPTAGFYLFGGLSERNEELNDLWVLKVTDGRLEWRLVQTSGSPPTSRYGHSATYVNLSLLVFGGRNDSLGMHGCLSDLSVFKLESSRWEKVQIYGASPDGRWGHCASTFGSKVLILGGICFQNFLGADLLVLETDQNYVLEMIRQDEADPKQERRRLQQARSAEVFPF